MITADVVDVVAVAVAVDAIYWLHHHVHQKNTTETAGRHRDIRCFAIMTVVALVVDTYVRSLMSKMTMFVADTK